MSDNFRNGRTFRERLLSRLIVEPGTGCLLWTGEINHGYGAISMDGENRRVHRVMYEMFAGPIPDGLTLDHLCRVQRCAAPAHLEPVTHRINVLRGIGPTAVNAAKTNCDKGHELDLPNTYFWRGKRYCRACRAAWDAQRIRRRS